MQNFCDTKSIILAMLIFGSFEITEKQEFYNFQHSNSYSLEISRFPPVPAQPKFWSQKNPGINTRSFGRTAKNSLQNEQLWFKSTKIQFLKTRSFGSKARNFGSKPLSFG
jgi:hypothetical protein